MDSNGSGNYVNERLWKSGN